MTIGSKSTSAVSAPSNDTKEECTKFVYVYVGSYSRAFTSDEFPPSPSSVDVDYSTAYDQLAAKEQSFLIKLLSDDSPYPTSDPSTKPTDSPSSSPTDSSSGNGTTPAPDASTHATGNATGGSTTPLSTPTPTGNATGGPTIHPYSSDESDTKIPGLVGFSFTFAIAKESNKTTLTIHYALYFSEKQNATAMKAKADEKMKVCKPKPDDPCPDDFRLGGDACKDDKANRCDKSSSECQYENDELTCKGKSVFSCGHATL